MSDSPTLTDFQAPPAIRRLVAVVVAPAVLLSLGSVPFPGHDEEDVFIESAVMQILNEGGHRVVDLTAHRVEPGHALGQLLLAW